MDEEKKVNWEKAGTIVGIVSTFLGALSGIIGGACGVKALKDEKANEAVDNTEE